MTIAPPSFTSLCGGGIMVVKSFKMVKSNRLFNLNQRVWIIFETGSLAAYCLGKYRGKGRYIRAWVRWDRKHDLIPNFQSFEIEDNSPLAKRIAEGVV